MRSYSSTGTFIIRVILGVIFLAHGLDKFQSGIGNIEGFFASLGIPAFMATVVAIIEIVGGIALIIGLGTRIASLVLGVVLIVAIFQAKLGMGFLGGYELDIALLAMAVHLALSGSSLLSVDSLFSKKNKA
ncbi:DoxX family protein [Paenibacillus glucanolyticus]|jgi:putative oxidoreductase|uniref:DoxX family protein n=1 Tax=Paenibacillus TaxID=44249 RepID=UPI0003E29570|nr:MULTISPECIES: DoxX family protein [Paenibacillus]ANA82943.1 oxidoreductase [Paenibacillus glucanolyticus]AVV57971.1 DoxX family protein [Paenibacillus glucanolyticus]AWP27131.1 oxidoreductase [Paenibacillus sp. Cedars]ETT34771.1 DoxX family protein [Paenibacillus sp. FSL R5-808]MDH6670521.1 putative oxidoreductase [Paenibacillus sp. LBL]